MTSHDTGSFAWIADQRLTLAALPRMLASPEPRMAALAALLGNAGRRSLTVNGSDIPVPSYLRILSRLCHEAAGHIEAEAGEWTDHELPLVGEISGTTLVWPGGTQDQLEFMRAVYARQIANAQSAGRSFVADVPASALSVVESGQQMRTEAAASCRSLLSALRVALADANRNANDRARQILSVSVVSGYRSASTQFELWQSNFRNKYYPNTASDRASMAGGPHGPDAISFMASYVGGRLGAPGFSLHNDGNAVDFGASLIAGRRLTTDTSEASIRLWRSSWLFQWLSDNAATYGFFQNTRIIEPWHWEYRGVSATSRDQEFEDVAYAPVVLRAASKYILNTPLLAKHRGTQPDLYICWNNMNGSLSPIDVVVHLHGHSSHRDKMQLQTKVAGSGLDFSDPAGSGGGRVPKSVGIIPRGHYSPRSATVDRPANPDVYSFPALTTATGMKDLIAYGLGQFAAAIGASTPVLQSRFILTCHSGGGDSLGQVLQNNDPSEIHLFDAMYGVPQALLNWIDRHISNDDAGGAGASALRMFYTDNKFTTPVAGTIAARVRDALRKAKNSSTLAPYFRVERTTVSHPAIPQTYGWQLLADASANVV